jgi:hypothetical protein
MHKLEVGRLYTAGCRAWPQGADYNWRSGGHELRIFLPYATQEEVAAIDSGPVEFGLIPDQVGLFLVVRFGPRLSFDCSYSWHRVDLAERMVSPPVEEVPPALRSLLSIVLVEATTGIVLGLRVVSFSPEFTWALHRAIADQIATTYDPAEHNRWADSMLRHTMKQLWEQCTIRCQGGGLSSPALLAPAPAGVAPLLPHP